MPARLAEDTGVKLRDFLDFQQLTTRAQQSAEQQITAQQQEIARLSEQVNVIAGKLDLLQRSAPSMDEPPRFPSVRPSPARRKNTSSPRPRVSPISVGGAPLPDR